MTTEVLKTLQGASEIVVGEFGIYADGAAVGAMGDVEAFLMPTYDIFNYGSRRLMTYEELVQAIISERENARMKQSLHRLAIEGDATAKELAERDFLGLLPIKELCDWAAKQSPERS